MSIQTTESIIWLIGLFFSASHDPEGLFTNPFLKDLTLKHYKILLMYSGNDKELLEAKTTFLKRIHELTDWYPELTSHLVLSA